jgi:hypothetical protein
MKPTMSAVAINVDDFAGIGRKNFNPNNKEEQMQSVIEIIGAGGRNRTDTGLKPRGILSQDPTNRRFPIIFEYL